ncbi:MAG: alkaline phosphatase D family protein [Bacteroidia bacterium]
MKQLALLFLCLLSTSVLAQLRSGPMLGYVEMREAAIWIQAEKSAVINLEYRAKGAAKWKNVGSTVTKADQAHIARFIIGNLEPGQAYEYRFYLNAKLYGKENPYRFNTQKLWQWREDPPNFKIAMGSCAYVSEQAFDRPGEPYGGDYHIFGHIAQQQPDMMLWLGDNVYLREADWNSYSGMLHRYNHSRQLPELQPLLEACPNYAIWDDHDFGPNDANGSWVHKQRSLELFKLFWANNSYGMPEFDGISSSFSFNDVDFFMLDNRFHRSSEKLADSCERQMLGDAQINWLINALKSSLASFKIVAVGSQVLNTEALYENYAQFPCEREKLLNAIAREGIKNVIFATGDRHHSELSRFEKEGIVMYDITASPLTSKAGHSRDNEHNKNRVEGSLIVQRNFTTLEISGPRKQRELLVRNFDSHGQELYSTRIAQQH